MRVKKLIALLMMYLIISLTFSTALVFATIYKAEIYGQDEVPGSIRESDTLTVRTESSYPCKVSGAFTNYTYEDMGCAAGTPVVCTFSQNIPDASGMVSAVVKEDISSRTANIEAYVDNQAPLITSMSASSLGNRAKVTYSITERGNPSYTNKCSGVERVELFLDGSMVNSSFHDKGDCSVTGVVTGTVAGYSGKVNTSIYVYDYVGLSVNKTGAMVSLDTLDPVISSDVTVFKAGTSTVIAAVALNSPIVFDIDVSIEIEDNAMASSGGVFGNFTLFDRTKSVDQSNVGATCTRKGWANEYTCKFSGVKMNLNTTSPMFLVTATDMAGNTLITPMSVSFTEHQGASVGNAKVYQAGTKKEIGAISTESSIKRSVDVAVEVSDKIKITSVKGDFKQLDKSGGQTDVSAACKEKYNADNEIYNYNCTFSGLSLNPKDANPKVVIKAADEVGKEVEEEISLSFNVINDAGTVNRVGPETFRCQENVCYVRAGVNNITAVISTSSTYNNSNVNIQGAKAKCKHVSAWECQANANFNAGDTTIRVTGTDDLGNKLTGQGAIVVDGTPPVNTSGVNKSHVCPSVEDTDFRIMVNVTDKDTPTMFIMADIDKISDENESKTTCTLIDDKKGLWQCVLPIPNLQDKEINTKIIVIVEDMAGNQIKFEVPVSVCVDVDEVPDLIDSINPRGTMPKVDRKIASKIVLKVAVPLEIKRKNTDVIIIERSTPDCSGTPGLQGSAYMINDNLKPILIVPLNCKTGETCNDEWDEDNAVVVNCTQEFKIKHMNKLYRKYPEVEQIIVKLDVYDQPLGTLSDAYNAKVYKLKRELKALDKSIENKKKVNDILGNFCKAAEAIGTLNALAQSVKATIWFIILTPGLTAQTTCVGGATVEKAAACAIYAQLSGLWLQIHGALSNLHKIVETWIWPSGFNYGLNTGTLFKLTCTYYTCKIYDVRLVVNILASVTNNIFNIWGEEKGAEQKSKEVAENPITTSYEDIPPGLDQEQYIYLTGDDSQEGWEFYQDTGFPHPSIFPQQELDTPSTTSNPTEGSIYDSWKPNFNFFNNPYAVGQPPLTSTTPSVKSYGSVGAGSSAQASGILNKLFSGTSGTGSPPDGPWDSESFYANSLESFVHDSGTLIYNPYKSVHYDDFCEPAKLFNARKERQIKCKQLGCIDIMAKEGGPLEACEFEAELDSCMYLESARYKLEDEKVNVLKAFFGAVLNNIVSLSLMIAYQVMCWEYMEPTGVGFGAIMASEAGKVPAFLLFSKPDNKHVLCGLSGAFFNVKEIISFVSNPMNALLHSDVPVDIPQEGIDFCQGGQIYQ